ncbi:hypothetical protein [Gordonia rubripertincta]|uniref:hypothetical protein n=1 Tax=Gordonia rubripertincta TaxID=36822 RepID=UPI000B8DA530|nr:hypothetical protein [Gordonia rubripertincta]ASR03676.1 hypothetical protein GCWB2_14425 [Gordonia rubripertincta]
MQLTDYATIVGPLVGLVGVGLAIWALVVSKRFLKTARDGNEHADRAVELARESNTIAADAKQVAEEANTISLRAEQRDTERHDVDWDLDRGDPGDYVLTNTGTDDARNVRVRVAVDDWVSTATFDLIAGGESATVKVPEAAQRFQRELAEIRRAKERAAAEERRRREQPFPNLVASYGIPDYAMTMQYQMHHVSYRVDWQTTLGKHRDESDQYTDSLGDLPG